MSTALRVKRVMRSKRLMYMRYSFAHKASYCVRISTALRVKWRMRSKRLMLQGLSWLFPAWQWQSCASQMLLRVAMTTWLSIWQFFDRPDSYPQRICPSDAMFRLFAVILTSDWVVRSSDAIFRLFPRRSLLPIGLSGLQGSVERPISNNDCPFLIITYVTRWSKFTVHYALCRVCKM